MNRAFIMNESVADQKKYPFFAGGVVGFLVRITVYKLLRLLKNSNTQIKKSKVNTCNRKGYWDIKMKWYLKESTVLTIKTELQFSVP